MNEKHKRLLAAIKSVNGLFVRSYSLAPGTGTFHIHFKATEQAIKKICQVCAKFNIGPTMIYLDGYDELSYNVMVSPWHFDCMFENILEEIKNETD